MMEYARISGISARIVQKISFKNIVKNTEEVVKNWKVETHLL